MEKVKMYDIHERAKRQGWTVIKFIDIPKKNAQAPGAVVICDVGDKHRPYAVHFFNKQDGGFHSGNYCPDIDTAMRVYAIRSLSYIGI